ncbi:MAG TPA: hypothetical protein PKJ41_12480 [Bryobacteraceae bacterium]|nr:hypothetical protein [Bryobacteraceae bacterium]
MANCVNPAIAVQECQFLLFLIVSQSCDLGIVSDGSADASTANTNLEDALAGVRAAFLGNLLVQEGDSHQEPSSEWAPHGME